MADEELTLKYRPSDNRLVAVLEEIIDHINRLVAELKQHEENHE